jgi:dihydroflavonol-4-reductase
VRVLILPGEDTQSLFRLPVEIVEGNVLDSVSLIKAMDGVDVVFHMAGLVSITPDGATIMEKVNVQGTQNVIDAVKATGVKQLIFTSSIHALERPPLGVSINETCQFDPENPAGAYDCTKAQASLLVKQAAQEGMDARIVCPTGVIGPHDYRRSEMGELIRGWTKNAINFGMDGAFDFVDVRDVAVGHILVRDQGKPGETYILGGERIELNALHKLIKKVTGKDKRFISFPLLIVKLITPMAEWYYKLTKTKPLVTRYSIETIISNSDISYEKAKRELGYKPRQLLNTIADTVDWWRENFEKTKRALRL